LYLCDKKKFFIAGLILALMSATRVTAVFFVIYLFYMIINEIKISNNEKNKFQIFLLKILEIIKKPYYLASLAVSMLGIATFMIVLDNYYGLSPIAFMDVQCAWDKENKFFLIHLIEGFGEFSTLLSSIFTLITIVFCIFLIVKEKKYFVPILMLVYIMIISSSSIASVDRYIWDMILLTIELYTLLIKYTPILWKK
jgi:hypothetical protein